MRKSCWLGQKGQRFNHINARKSWYGLEGDGPNSSSQKQGLSGLTSGHDENLARSGFPALVAQEKGSSLFDLIINPL